MSQFTTTHWSVVLQAGEGESAQSHQALELLCRDYWNPVCAYICRMGYSQEDGKDLTQGFFNRLLEKGHIKLADPNRGRFRTFLLTSARRFVRDERDRAQAQKRGGGERIVSLDEAAEESGFEPARPDWETPEMLFERQWANAFMGNVLDRLRLEMETAGKGARFDALKGALLGDRDLGAYSNLGERLGLSEGALKNVVYRMRRRFAELVREQAERLVEHSADVDDEIRHLLRASRMTAMPAAS